MLGVLMVGVLAAVALGQTPSAGGAGTAPLIDPVTGLLPSLKNLFLSDPIINGILLVLSVISLLLFLFFLLTINARSMVPSDFVDEATKLVLRGRYEQTADLCRQNRGVFAASVIQRAAENAGQGHSVLLDMIDSEGKRRADVVWNRISYLADLSNVAPMLGLLGTVIGMIRAFAAVQLGQNTAAASGLAGGVAQAMSTTMFGLIVGILSLVFYSIIKSRATRTLAEVEQAVHSITDKIKQQGERGDERGGERKGGGARAYRDVEAEGPMASLAPQGSRRGGERAGSTVGGTPDAGELA